MHALPLEWTPGEGGLLALVAPEMVPALVMRSVVPGACPVRPLHLTLLRSASMGPLVPVLGPHWPRIQCGLPRVPAPILLPRLERATRPPHPRRDPPGESRSRTTWFVQPADPDRLRAAVAAIVSALDEHSRAHGGPAFPHPEPARFFHVSVFNDRGGDPRRSIGDIGASDCGGGAVP